MTKHKILKLVIMILDIIGIPLLVIQAIGDSINITGIVILLISNIIIFTGKQKNNKEN